MTTNFEHQVFTSPLEMEVAPKTINRRNNNRYLTFINEWSTP
jgi:hypothetical protein